MFDVFCLGVALAVGQGGPVAPQPMPPSAAGRATLGDELPSRFPAALPTVGVPGMPDGWAPARTVSQEKTPADPKADPKAGTAPKTDAEPKPSDNKAEDK